MMRPLLERARWEIARAWAALGPRELVAIAAVALWWGLHAQVTEPLTRQVQTVAARVQDLRSRHAAQQHAVARVSQGRAELRDFLPSASSRDAQLLKLHQLASRQGLVVERIAFQSERLSAVAVTRLTLHLDVQGTYAAQRRALHAFLEELPNLAVDRVTLERSAEMGDAMSARWDASLYYRNEGGS